MGWEIAIVRNFKDFTQTIAGLVSEVRLVVVNDGSTRNMEHENFENLRNLLDTVQIVTYTENRGKGYALRQGVAAAEAEFYMVTDADFPYTLLSMQHVLASLLQHGGVAAGNRDTMYYEKVPFFRKMLSQTLRWMLRNLLRLPISDSQCGLKGFDHAGRAVFLQTSIDRFLFDLEFLMLTKGRVAVTPVPVELREGIVFSKVGWKVLATEGRNFIKLFIFNILRS